jgi:hypothetical protein
MARARRTSPSAPALLAGAAAALLLSAAPSASAARVLAGSSSTTAAAAAVRRVEEQQYAHHRHHSSGSRAAAPSSSSSSSSFLGASSSAPPPPASCLAIFDVDRTLTGLQGSGSGALGDKSCPADVTKAIDDAAYRGGHLTLSSLAVNIAKTYAGQNCYLGIISHGDATSTAERAEVAKLLSSDGGGTGKMQKAASLAWADAAAKKAAPFIYSAPDATKKYEYVPLIQKYYESIGGSKIKDADVYFFDDIAANVVTWKDSGKGYNAQQVSCDSRDASQKDLGKCGATVAELAKHKPGCNLCKGSC